MAELKPCPFCGGEAVIDELVGGVWFAACKNCGITFAPLIVADSKGQAAEDWNRRADNDRAKN